MRHIVCLSGGKASAWCADWVLKNVSDEVVLYFNDTKWEHKDLYRFLNDLSKHWGKEIYFDSDGRSPEEVFYDRNFLANNRVPLCSQILKAERLQKFVQEGDILYFGIGSEEVHRAIRIKEVYKKYKVVFPLLVAGKPPFYSISSEEITEWLKIIGIEEPELYKKGFSHNNCSGGCVRQGKKAWLHLLQHYPEVYAEREREIRERVPRVLQ